MRVVVIGAGFVGLTTSVSLAETGHEVVLVEIDAKRRAALDRRTLPFHEPGLAEAFSAACEAGRIRVSAEIAAALPADVALVCVGTPSRPDGSADLGYVERAAEALALAIQTAGAPCVVAVKSTVPPGTCRGVVLPRLARIGEAGIAFGLASNPEFLKEGSALADARAPDRIVVGALDPLAARIMRALYEGAHCPYVATTLETAETIKYAANAMLATKITFANEIANLAERVGVHVDEVMDGVGMDQRIGRAFLTAGLGFGGSCFPKDVSALAALARAQGVPTRLLDAVLEANEAQPLRAVELARELTGPLRGKRVVILGLAFKVGTSDVRETRALPLYRALLKEGADVTCCDPVAGDEFRALVGDGVVVEKDPLRALEGHDVAILHTAWPGFIAIAPEEFRARMRRAAVVDGRRVLDVARFEAAGVSIRALGVGSTEAKR